MGEIVMGFLKNVFGDNRVLTAKNPEIQEMLLYMDKKYNANIIEYNERGKSSYFLQCRGKKYFDFLYSRGYLVNGHIEMPGKAIAFNSKVEAYEGLIWLYNLLEGQERNKKYDEEWF